MTCKVLILLVSFFGWPFQGEERKEAPKKAPPPKPKTLVTPGKMEKGPKLFYDGDSFMMRVRRPIRVTVFKGGVRETDIQLDESAASVKGGYSADKTEFKASRVVLG